MSHSSRPTTARSILKLTGATPFLDLHWLFDVDPIHLAMPFKRRRSKPSGETTFAAFKRAARKSESAFAKQWRKARGPDDGFDDFSLFSDYLIVTGPAGGASEVQFCVHYERLVSLLESLDFTPDMGTTLIELVIAPVLAWRTPKALRKQARLTVVKTIEAAIDVAQRRVRDSRFSDDWMVLQNRLTYAYLVVTAVWKVGLHPVVLSRHLHVFRKCSASDWSNLRDSTRMQFAGLAFHMMRASYDLDQPFQTKLGFSHGTLADMRTLFHVMAQGPVNTAFTTHQWLYRWLADKLDSDVFSARSQHVTVAEHLRALSGSEQMMIVELARRFSAYRVPVTTDRVADFVLQFGSTLRIQGALRLLSHIKFMPLWELSAAMERVLAARLAAQPNERLIVAPLGDQTGSTAIIRYLAAHSSLEGIEFKDDIASALAVTKQGDRLHFIDDCLLSGTQALSILGDWMGMRQHKGHHTVYSPPLDISLRDELRERRLVFAYCVGTDFGQTRFREKFAETGLRPEQVDIQVGVVDPISSKAFEPLGPVGWASEEERQSVREFASEVGYDLLRDRASEKSWTDQRHQESALGYSDFQRLLVFPYNVPKTTLTLLWAKGNNERRWRPLFPGYD